MSKEKTPLTAQIGNEKWTASLMSFWSAVVIALLLASWMSGESSWSLLGAGALLLFPIISLLSFVPRLTKQRDYFTLLCILCLLGIWLGILSHSLDPLRALL